MKSYNYSVVIIMVVCINGVFAGMYRPLPSVPQASFTMDSILNGALDGQGSDFAWKANQIYRYNYSKAASRRAANLNATLTKNINEINANTSFDQATKMGVMRGTINNLYATLEGYKVLDNQLTTVRPLPSVPVTSSAATFTLQSILDGLLGEPYTGKAQQIYNGADDSYRNNFVEKINYALSSSYVNEATKINALKSVVDSFYNFLGSHRKSMQQAAPAPSGIQTFSLQAVLNGVLGEPYTSKAQEIYNSGISVYVDALVKDINRDVNARYSNDSARIRALQLSVDKNYNFLTNYRKSNQ